MGFAASAPPFTAALGRLFRPKRVSQTTPMSASSPPRRMISLASLVGPYHALTVSCIAYQPPTWSLGNQSSKSRRTDEYEWSPSIQSMPAFFQYLTMIMPARWLTVIARDSYLKGAPFTQMWGPFAALAILCVVMVLLATRKFKTDLEP